jgi:hypothetical protein
MHAPTCNLITPTTSKKLKKVTFKLEDIQKTSAKLGPRNFRSLTIDSPLGTTMSKKTGVKIDKRRQSAIPVETPQKRSSKRIADKKAAKKKKV